MAKLVLLVICAAVAVALAEPPSSYLPPQSRNAPSSQYGAPAFGSGNGNGRGATSFHSQRTGSQSFSYNAQHGATQTGVSQFRSAGHGTFGASRSSFAGRSSSSSFGARANAQQYSAPGQGFSAPAQTYGAPSQGFTAPAQTYGAPSQGFDASAQAFSAPAQTYGAPSQGFGGNGFARQGSFGGAAAGRASFGSASAGHGSFGAARNGFGASSGSFSSSSQGSSSRGFAAPAQSYSAPAAQSFSAPSAQYGPPSTQYGAPSARYGAPFGRKMDDDLAEPANYEYNYQVQAGDDSGAEFGHQESRENEAAKGSYHVLLPDGRMQIVEYEADEEGFRPNIRYEETGGYHAARSNNGLQGPY